MQLDEWYMYAMLMTSLQYFFMAKTLKSAFSLCSHISRQNNNVKKFCLNWLLFQKKTYCGFIACQSIPPKNTGNSNIHFAWKDILFELLGWMFTMARGPWFAFDLCFESKYFVISVVDQLNQDSFMNQILMESSNYSYTHI